MALSSNKTFPYECRYILLVLSDTLLLIYIRKLVSIFHTVQYIFMQIDCIIIYETRALFFKYYSIGLQKNKYFTLQKSRTNMMMPSKIYFSYPLNVLIFYSKLKF